MEGNKMGKDKINKNIMDKKMSRRKLLATMGAAGAAVVSGAMISGTGTGSEVSANPNREANENTYRYSGELPERTVGDKLRECLTV